MRLGGHAESNSEEHEGFLEPLTDSEEPEGFATVPPSRRSESLGEWRHCRAGLSRLHDELVALSRQCSPSPADAARVAECVAAVERKAKKLVPNMRAHLFGSRAAGLATLGSDIDLVLLSPAHFLDSNNVAAEFSDGREHTIEFMSSLAEKLRPKPFVRVDFLSRAAVPVIKGTTSDSLQCDVSVGLQGGLRACKVVAEKVGSFAELRPLVLVLKLILKERGLNEVFTGGLSSYAIFHLVLSFLQASGPGVHDASKFGTDRESVSAALQPSPFPYFVNLGHGRTEICSSDDTEKTCGTVSKEGGVDEGGEAVREGIPRDKDLGRLLVEICELYGGAGSGYKRSEEAICCRRGLVSRRSTRLAYPAARSGYNGDPVHKRIAIVGAMQMRALLLALAGAASRLAPTT